MKSKWEIVAKYVSTPVLEVKLVLDYYFATYLRENPLFNDELSIRLIWMRDYDVHAFFISSTFISNNKLKFALFRKLNIDQILGILTFS